MKERVFAHLQLVDFLAEKRFPNSSLATEATLFVLEKLEKDDWKKVRAFRSQAKFSTFLAVVVRRLLEDFSNKKFKKVRPPVWVKKLGGLWLKIFRYLCLERLSISETVETMIAAVPDRSSQEIEIAANKILDEIHDCGSYHGMEFQTEDQKLEKAASKRTGNPGFEENLDEHNCRLLFEAVSNEFLDGHSSEGGMNRFVENFSRLKLNLDPEARLLLKLRFVEGMTVSAACRKLQMTDYDGRKKIKDTLQMLRETFAQSGLEEEIREFLLGKEITSRHIH